MNTKTVIALGGFVVLGLSPSFVDWQESDITTKCQIVIYYAVALSLIYVGILKND
jgi:hypothetical protein